MRVNPAALGALRERSGLTQSALARASGVSQSRISELERGDVDGCPLPAWPTTVRALADALQVPILALAAPWPPCVCRDDH